MNILVTGGTGFIGSRLVKTLLSDNHKLVLLCRNVAKARKLLGDRVELVTSFQEITTPIDAVINLAGEPIIGQRWTDKRKQVLMESRVGLTRELLQWITTLSHKPHTLISGSAIGYYGNYPEDIDLNEASSPRYCFPSELCQQWEFEALKARSLGVRVCLVRTGVVLDKKAGALKKMWLPFLLGAGGRVASGQQWFSWIHIKDMVRVLLFLLHNEKIEGPVNATAPTPVMYDKFTQTLAKTLSRPHFFPMTEWFLNTAFGEAAQLLIEGQKVVPKALLDTGFVFRFNTIDKALQHIAKNKS